MKEVARDELGSFRNRTVWLGRYLAGENSGRQSEVCRGLSRQRGEDGAGKTDRSIVDFDTLQSCFSFDRRSEIKL